MPTKTFLKPAFTISSHSSASSARLTEASVKKPMLGPHPLPPGDQLAEQGLGAVLIANEIVVHDKHHVLPALEPEGLEFRDQLGGRLGAGDAPVHDDDVAELAVIRATARELDGHRDVVPEIDQVPARRRHPLDVWPVGGAVLWLEGARAHVGHQLRHDVLGFAQHKMLNRRKGVMAGSEEGAAGDNRLLERRAAGDDFMHRLLVDDHGADHDVIRPAQVAVFEALNVQIHQLKLPIGRQHRGDGEQTERWKSGALGDEAQDVLEAPERIWVSADRPNSILMSI